MYRIEETVLSLGSYGLYLRTVAPKRRLYMITVLHSVRDADALDNDLCSDMRMGSTMYANRRPRKHMHYSWFLCNLRRT